jgi:hypothetical protein
LNPRTFSGQQDKTKSLNTVITWYLGIFVTFPVTHFQLVEAMHAPQFLLIFKISEVRHLAESAFLGRQDS